ncbi:MAG: hypothetical protein EHM17_03890 [Verrucomicrobiaceae bacterium]|jgi:hypothetical protein|nr:MAG: hypothetical protein EHM17_03890 [Verrucomicrobiaceae bacterium]
MHPERRHRHFGATALPGLSLLEMTVVIMVLMSLISILFFGARAWKRGSDRAICIIHIQNVQKALRGYSNIHGFSPGANAPDLQARLIGIGGFIDAAPVCPGSGDYSFGETYGPDTIPPLGTLYMECSLATSDDHVPIMTSDW